MRTYDVTIDDIEFGTGIKFLSIVDDPAIEIKGLYFSKLLTPPMHDNCKCEIVDGKWILDELACPYCIEHSQKYKRNKGNKGNKGNKNTKFSFSSITEKQIIVGPAIIANLPIKRIDKDGEYYVRFTPENIQKLVSKFHSLGTLGKINVDHSDRIIDAYIQQNWIVEDLEFDKSRFYGFDLPIGSWFVEVKVNDVEFWNNDVKELGKFGFSIEGLLNLRPMEFVKELTMDEYIDTLSYEDIMNMIKVLTIGSLGVLQSFFLDFLSLLLVSFPKNDCFKNSLYTGIFENNTGSS